MKKVFVMLLLIALVVACTKETVTYQKAIIGTWPLYKYLLHNADQTLQFEANYPGYAITFTSNGTFLETDTAGYTKGGTYHFTSNNQILALDDTVYNLVDTVVVASIAERQYTLFNLTSVSVQLRNDTSELYLQKKL